MFLFPITLFAQQRVDVTGKTLVVSNNGEGQEVLPYTNILVLEAGDSTLVKGVMSDAGGNFRLSFHAKKESPYLLKVSLYRYEAGVSCIKYRQDENPCRKHCLDRRS